MSASRAEAIVHQCRTPVITSIGGFKVVEVKKVRFDVIGVTYVPKTLKANGQRQLEDFLRCISDAGVHEIAWGV
jgi:hypothetical protein